MTKTHEIKLDGYGAHTTLAEDRPIMLLGTAESYGIEMLHVVSGKSWEGLTVTATFNAPDGTSTDMLMNADGSITVPSEATAKSGSGKIVFTGVSEGVQRISCDLEYFVVAHSAINGVQSGGTAPSWFEQAATRFMPSGGTAGQVLTKLTDTDFDAKWQDSQGGADGKSAYSYAVEGGYTGTEEEFAAKLAEETGTVPENVALLEDVTVDEASGDFIPMLSKNGTEYRLSIGDDGVPVIKNANGATVWSGTSGGSSGGGDTGGDDPGSDTPTGEWASGAEVAYNLVEGEWANADGSFVPYDGYSRTDFIYCYGAGHIYHSCFGNFSINIVFYGIDKKFVSSHNGYDAWTAIPENAAYVVISYITESMTGSVIKLYKKVEPTWTDGKPYEFTFVENEYVNTGNGEFVSYSGWKRTDYVNCAGAIKITKTNASAYSQYGAFYNAEKERIEAMKIPDTTGGTSADITVPVGACYFITSDSNANMDALVLIPYA